MRRICPLGLMVLLLSIPAFATSSEPPDGSWLALEASSPGDPARVEQVDTAHSEVHVVIAVPGLTTGIEETRGGPRGRIVVPGAGIIGKPGEPGLPALRYLVEVPPASEVLVTLTPESVRRVSLAALGIDTRLMPVQLPVPKIEGARATIPYMENAEVYTTDGYLPAEPAVLVERSVLRGRHVALIEVRPVRYNPAAGSIEVWSRAELRVVVEAGAPAVALREKKRLASPPIDAWIEREIVGRPDAIADGPLVPTGSTSASGGAVGMLVIAYDGFAAALDPFLDWKEKTGFKIELLRTSEISANPTDTQLKAEIQQRYDTWSDPPLDYLLLVGDTDFCPIHLGHGGGNSQVTDNWYAGVDGTDYLPDLAVARISTRSAAETADVVDKLLTYERATFPAGWIKQAGFIGTNDSGHWGLIENTHNWCIDTYYTPNGYVPTPWSHGGDSCDRHYRSYGASTADIAASIDAGRSMVNYSGHGGYYSWEGPTSYGSYDQSDILGNTNAGMYPFVISNACITGTLDRTECFGETWLKAPNKGAIGFWGASNNSYWDEDDVLQRDLHDNIFPMDTTPPLGVLVAETKLDLYDHYGPNGTVAYYFDMYNLLSEPSLSMWTREPLTLDVSYPEGHPIGESVFGVTVMEGGRAVEGALVAVRKQDDSVFEAGYTDVSGQVTLLLDPAPVSVGDMQVTVTGHDLRPHEGVTEVISPDSPWLTHRSHAVDDSVGGDGDGNANAGEHLVIAVTVENVGMQPATGVQATLTTSTPQWCEVLDADADFPDMLPGELGGSLPDHYTVHVLDGAPDGVSLGFELAWSAAGGHAGVTSFSQQVQAVDLNYVSHAIDDTAFGNGNGVAGPGETVDMSVVLENVGHRDATGVTAVLDTDSVYVTLLQDTVAFPDIPADGQGGSLPPAFSFAVSSDAPDQAPVTFTLTVDEAGSGFQEVVLFDVTISSCATTDSTDVPQPINDNSTSHSQLTYPQAISVEEVNVFVDITHTYIGDLKVILQSPEGTQVVLHNRTGGSANDIVTWYDTETAPAQTLDAFIGENTYGTWELIVEDHAGGDTGILNAWSLEVCGEQISPIPILNAVGLEVDDSGACNPDGVGDVGETVTLNVRVRNDGWSRATGVQVDLSSTALVAVLNGPFYFFQILPGEQVTAPFEVLVGAVGCIEQVEYTVDIQALEGTWSRTFVRSAEADLAQSLSIESVERQGQEPPNWVHWAAAGIDDWRVSAVRNHTPVGNYSWFSSDQPTLKDDRLISPMIYLGDGNPQLQFYHWVDLQSGYDGGVLEISIDGGQSFQDVGPFIQTGQYDRSLGGTNPIAGRDAWTGSFDEWRWVVVDLTPWAGEVARFQWRLTCDSATARIGWWVDDIALRTYTEVCDRHACGVPGEVQLAAVTKDTGNVQLEWYTDPVCLEFEVWRSSDPTTQEAFVDVTGEDPDPTDTQFVDGSNGDLLYWIVVGVGPDGVGPWGHYEPVP